MSTNYYAPKRGHMVGRISDTNGIRVFHENDYMDFHATNRAMIVTAVRVFFDTDTWYAPGDAAIDTAFDDFLLLSERGELVTVREIKTT